MKRTSELHEFEAWNRFKKMKAENTESDGHSSNSQSKMEKQAEFEEYMEWENMRNNHLEKQKHTESPTSNGSSTSSLSRASTVSSTSSRSSGVNRKALSDGHRQFRVPFLELSPADFKNRLEERLSEEVMKGKLVTLFQPFSVFREKYIIPLSEAYSGENVEMGRIRDTSGFDTAGFMTSYADLFVDGCLVQRKGRREGLKGARVIPDTKERIMFRNLFKDLWELLGNFSFQTPYFITKIIIFGNIHQAFDVDGYGTKIRDTSQSVLGWNSKRIRMEFAAHVSSFCLNGIKSFTHYKMIMRICTTEGNVSILLSHIQHVNYPCYKKI